MDKLPDVLTPHLDVVLCGTAAGTRSAKIGAHDAAPPTAFEALERWNAGTLEQG